MEAVDEPSCGHGELWLARDGWWRCTRCDPPHFAGEVVGEQTREEQLEMWDDQPWEKAA